VHTTFLGAHALPPEMAGDKDAYIERVIGKMLPTLAAEGLCDSVDGFCEGIAFLAGADHARVRRREALGLRVRLHADQLSNLHGAAARRHAWRAVGRSSRIHRRSRRRRARASRHRRGAAAGRLLLSARTPSRRRSNCCASTASAMAVATDNNPGTSPMTSLLLAMNMAATQFRLTVDECLARRHARSRARTRHGRRHRHAGSRQVRRLRIWNIKHPAELVYRIGFNPLHSRIWRGQ
jgi:imidazolonepropionase